MAVFTLPRRKFQRRRRSMMWSLLFILPTALAIKDSFIVGGDDVEIENYPWQGSYRGTGQSHNCGCVYVGDNFALTAAHCGGSSSTTMEFGNTNRNTGPYTPVTSVTPHPNYGTGPGFSPNDISIVTISGDVQGNAGAGEIPENDVNPEGNGAITGWGRTTGGGVLPITLQGVNTPIISDTLCATQHGSSFDSSNMICVWNEASQDTGACNGDSGGPLSDDDGVILGLTSWGRSGCLTTFPSVYAKTGTFRSWICENTSEEVEGCDDD